jgi:hypothetical protein
MAIHSLLISDVDSFWADPKIMAWHYPSAMSWWQSDLVPMVQPISTYYGNNNAGLVMVNSAEDPEKVIALIPVIPHGKPAELELLDHGGLDEPGACHGRLVFLTHGSEELTAADADYVEHHALLKSGQHYRVELSAFVGAIQPQAKSFTIDRGPMVEIERKRRAQAGDPVPDDQPLSVSMSMAQFHTWVEKDTPCWYEGVLPIRGVREIEFAGQRGWSFTGNISHTNEPDLDLECSFLVMEHNCAGYIPQEDDLVAMTVFLQVSMKEAIDYQGTPWADRISHREDVMSDINAMFQSLDQCAESDPVTRISAMLLAQNGWTVTLTEHPRILEIESQGQTHRLALVEAHVPATSLPPADYYVPLTCTPLGKGHELKFQPTPAVTDLLRLHTLELWVADDAAGRPQASLSDLDD